MLDFNGELRSASAVNDGLRFTYASSARALALVNKRPRKFELDGAMATPKLDVSGSDFVLTLPRGQHVVQIAP